MYTYMYIISITNILFIIGVLNNYKGGLPIEHYFIIHTTESTTIVTVVTIIV